MTILGIETTCDETGVAIVSDGRKIICNFVASSAALQSKSGGIVPELAAREQIKFMTPLLSRANSTFRFEKLDAIAVACGPGLVGSLLIGVESAKTLSLVLNKPLIAVNHLIGHIVGCWIEEVKNTPEFPVVALVVSGGHTDLLLMQDFNNYKWLGGTRDDACGEAFDKVARMLGLEYPGGPEIENMAKTVKKRSFGIMLSRPMIHDKNFDFSFSGIKTQVANIVDKSALTKNLICEIAFEFQQAVCDVLVAKTLRAASLFGAKSICVSGGVSANSTLREKFEDSNFNVYFPEKKLSVDNGAMIAAAAFFKKDFVNSLELQVSPGLHF